MDCLAGAPPAEQQSAFVGRTSSGALVACVCVCVCTFSVTKLVTQSKLLGSLLCRYDGMWLLEVHLAPNVATLCSGLNVRSESMHESRRPFMWLLPNLTSNNSGSCAAGRVNPPKAVTTAWISPYVQSRKPHPCGWGPRSRVRHAEAPAAQHILPRTTHQTSCDNLIHPQPLCKHTWHTTTGPLTEPADTLSPCASVPKQQPAGGPKQSACTSTAAPNTPAQLVLT